ncbi:unnamed protein product [Rotaria magnacalcarata]|uniref:Uncharacterized protein n=1 Tax=Rotaria magnacalcarata TaxID=392030 RepID=A0A814FEH3_9BILA|nr:unnamed protein product [Rotaria magnacalcarata]CAF1490601.1 unnamed protein product [Rotaria magnacalcarata]CAF2216855.1 unnamed protein product [Rotaria magnacalcarata]CAF2229864.1 unnamed protein product [Rotaria magnacalcarata]CAF2274140.1 unnamed protein product [Rotaria magnacalcarata]
MKITHQHKMLFKTSTPKKPTLTPSPRSSTPNKFYTLIKNKINDNNDRPKVLDEKCCQHYQIPNIKLDLLLYRPKTECYHRDQNIRQIWDI